MKQITCINTQVLYARLCVWSLNGMCAVSVEAGHVPVTRMRKPQCVGLW